MRDPLRIAALAGALCLLAPRAEAATLGAGTPEAVSPGWTRTAVTWDAGEAAPAFRVVARCPGRDGVYELGDAVVHVAPEKRTAWVDLPGTPERPAPAGSPCADPEVVLEMRVADSVVASAPIAATPAPAPRLRITGQRYGSRVGPRTEAGLAWVFDRHLSIQLNYARTAQVPLMPYATDNGILARLRFGF